MTADTRGDAAVRAFLELASDFGARPEWGPAELATALEVPLHERREESFGGYRLYRGRGVFAGVEVTAELRDSRHRRLSSPLLLVLVLTPTLPLRETLLDSFGPPDVDWPPDPHLEPGEPEYSGYRRGNALASVGIADGLLTELVLQVPG